MRASMLSLLSCSACALHASAGIVVLQDTRYLTAEAYSSLNGVTVMHVGPLRADRPEFGASWQFSLEAQASVQDDSVHADSRIQSTITANRFRIGSGGGGGYDISGQRPEVCWAVADVLVDMVVRVDPGTRAWFSGYGSGLTVTDEFGQTLSLETRIITGGTYHVQAYSRFVSGWGYTGPRAVDNFWFQIDAIVPAPGAAALLPLGALMATRRRRSPV